MKIFALLFLLLFISCSDPQKTAEIQNLQKENEAMQIKVKVLKHRLDSISAQNDSVYHSLKDLDMVH